MNTLEARQGRPGRQGPTVQASAALACFPPGASVLLRNCRTGCRAVFSGPRAASWW